MIHEASFYTNAVIGSALLCKLAAPRCAEQTPLQNPVLEKFMINGVRGLMQIEILRGYCTACHSSVYCEN